MHDMMVIARRLLWKTGVPEFAGDGVYQPSFIPTYSSTDIIVVSEQVNHIYPAIYFWVLGVQRLLLWFLS